MTLEDTNTLKSEIKIMIDKLGFTFLTCEWLDNLSETSKATLSEYHNDVEILGKREIAAMLYHNQDTKIWNLIMKTCK